MTARALIVALILSQAPGSFQELERSYGVSVEVSQEAFSTTPAKYTVAGKPASEDQVKKYMPLFTKEWSLYPHSLMKKAKVTRIIICRDLSVNGQARAAVPAFEIDTMYYDAELGSYAPKYQRTVVHHEFFHMMDQRMGVMRKDPEWSALNAKDFGYGTGGKNMRNGDAGALREDLPGFLTQYGTAAVEEDKAELFAHLIVSAKFVADRAAKDPILANKIKLLKKRLEKFDPEMGEKFWVKVGK
ncbi:MAG: hypothetical protein KF784_11290 [Fimbriimonadaceae bacterium]|nr:hypothetical protein [Fimbriimonadaceae bacterium]